MFNKNLYFSLFRMIAVLALVFFTSDILAQCPMCRAAAEQNLAEGHDASKGLNRGIMYLFLTPYTIVLTLGIVWYLRYRKMKDF